MIELTIEGGVTVKEACKNAIAVANREGEEVSFCFNGIAILAYPGAHPEVLEDVYWHTRGVKPIGEKCGDCKGSGNYTGLHEVRPCPTCNGVGTK
jgi:hypothetical protein